MKDVDSTRKFGESSKKLKKHKKEKKSKKEKTKKQKNCTDKDLVVKEKSTSHNKSKDINQNVSVVPQKQENYESRFYISEDKDVSITNTINDEVLSSHYLSDKILKKKDNPVSRSHRRRGGVDEKEDSSEEDSIEIISEEKHDVVMLSDTESILDDSDETLRKRLSASISQARLKLNKRIEDIELPKNDGWNINKGSVSNNERLFCGANLTSTTSNDVQIDVSKIPIPGVTNSHISLFSADSVTENTFNRDTSQPPILEPPHKAVDIAVITSQIDSSQNAKRVKKLAIKISKESAAIISSGLKMDDHKELENNNSNFCDSQETMMACSRKKELDLIEILKSTQRITRCTSKTKELDGESENMSYDKSSKRSRTRSAEKPQKKLKDGSADESKIKSRGGSNKKSRERSDRRSRNRSSKKSRDRSSKRSRDRSSKRSPYRSIKKSRNRSKKRSQDRSGKRSRDRSGRRSRDRSGKRSRDRSGIRSRRRSQDRSTRRSRDRSTKRSRDRSTKRSRDRSTKRSRDRSTKRSRDRPSRRSRDTSRPIRRSPERSKRRSVDSERKSAEDLTPAWKIDKARLRQIAIKNALQHVQPAAVTTVLPVVMKPEDVPLIKAGGKSLEELTEFCKKISEVEIDDIEIEGLLSGATQYVDEEEMPFIPARTNKDMRSGPIKSVMTLQRKLAQAAQMSSLFPVSSGNEHKDQHPGQPDNLLDIMKLSSEPDLGACKVDDVKQVPSGKPLFVKDELTATRWVTAQEIPGQFTGSTGVQKLSYQELSGTYQAWAKKDTLNRAPPVAGGIGKLLLQRMGWKEGEGLGKNNEGMKVPLAIDIKTDRKGLVAPEEDPDRLRKLAIEKAMAQQAIMRQAVMQQAMLRQAAMMRHQLQNNPQGTSRPLLQMPPLLPLRMPSARPPLLPMPNSHVNPGFLDLTSKHPVSFLTEICSKRHWDPPEFILLEESGPSHSKLFRFKIIVNGAEYISPDSSLQKKTAKMEAATACLQKLGLVP